MINYPKVSCVCPTFGRAHLLEEAIESFHRQDYPGEKELIICNDFIKQHFIYNHPEVKVINLPERCPNLGYKKNYTYDCAEGELILTWEDDDIHLPGRISRMVNSMQSLDAEFVFEGPYYILYGGVISKESGKTTGTHIITKDLFNRSSKYPQMNSGQDSEFNKSLQEKLGHPLHICKDDPQFLYRFSTGRVHISQFGRDSEDKESGYDLVYKFAKESIAKLIEPGGEYELKPHWSKDWEQEVKKAIVKNKKGTN